MSDAFYNKMATTAKNLLAKFGVAWTITRNTGEVIDNITGAVTSAGTSATFTPKGVLTVYDKRLMGNGRIEQGDRLLILDDTVLPLMTDKPTINGVVWNIQDIEIVEPAGIPLVYKVQVRG